MHLGSKVEREGSELFKGSSATENGTVRREICSTATTNFSVANVD
jgi:hypothetical protein